MSVPYVPNKSNAVGPGYAAVAPTLNDPGASGYTAQVPTRWDAKFGAWPIINELLLIQQIQYMGGGAIQVYNATGGLLNNGPVRISGYFGNNANTGNPIFNIVAANANTNTFTDALLLTSLANTTQGIAYIGGNFTPSPALDTHLATIGDPVYLAAGGGMTLAAPNGPDQMVQEVGRVNTLSATIAIVAGNIKPVQVFGTSFLQTSAVPSTVPTVLTTGQTLKVAANFGIVGARHLDLQGTSQVLNSGDIVIIG